MLCSQKTSILMLITTTWLIPMWFIVSNYIRSVKAEGSLGQVPIV